MLGLILGTGPSLAEVSQLIPRFPGLVFGPNNTYQDFDLDVWLACDPLWHEYNDSPVQGDFDKWHWDHAICALYGYKYIEGVWVDGLWLKDKTKISLNHCSGAQLLNLAASVYECDPVLLVGHDFHYDGPKRHYFDNLSNVPGEYPKPLRKHSLFDKSKTTGGNDLMNVYRHIAEQPGIPRIINCTPGSKLPWFEMGDLEDFL